MNWRTAHKRSGRKQANAVKFQRMLRDLKRGVYSQDFGKLLATAVARGVGEMFQQWASFTANNALKSPQISGQDRR